MDIFISGAACRAVFSEGAETYFVNLDRPDEHIHCGSDQIPVAAISLLLGNSPDIRRVSAETLEDGLKLSLSDCNKDSSLRLFQLIADFQEDLDLATDAASVLEPLLKDDNTHTFLRNYSFAIPVDPGIDQSTPPETFNKYPLCGGLLTQVMASQQHIHASRAAWERVSKDHFPTRELALLAEKRFVECGGFWHIVQTMLGNSTRDDVAIHLLMLGGDLYGSRQLVNSWIDALGLERTPKAERSTIKFSMVSSLEGAAYSSEVGSPAFFGKSSDKFQRVTGEKDAVVARIQRNDLRNARRLLVNWCHRR